MRGLVLLLCVIASSAAGRNFMWTIVGTEPVAMYSNSDVSYWGPQEITGYIVPGERIYSDTAHGHCPGYVHVFRQDGGEGVIRPDLLKPAGDTVMFRFHYGREMFPFSSDTSVYGRTYFLYTGWRGITDWMNYKDSRGVNYDTLNVPLWTKLAYDGDSKALLILLTNDYGDGGVQWQYAWNNWKLVNHWSDSALADLFLRRWMSWTKHKRECICGIGFEDNRRMCTCGSGPAKCMIYDMADFGPLNKQTLLSYYRLYYPLCYSLIMRDLKFEVIDGHKVYSHPTPKEFRKFRRQIKSSKH